MAKSLEKLQRDFLSSGVGEGKMDGLLRWEVVCRSKGQGGLGLGNFSLRNCALLRKWLWRFPRERSGLWHEVISKYLWDTSKRMICQYSD